VVRCNVDDVLTITSMFGFVRFHSTESQDHNPSKVRVEHALKRVKIAQSIRMLQMMVP
jgi:hypothetical protein